MRDWPAEAFVHTFKRDYAHDAELRDAESVLATAHAAHPERFPRGLPQPPACPTEVWINPPDRLHRHRV